jgi:hypothetical protein
MAPVPTMAVTNSMSSIVTKLRQMRERSTNIVVQTPISVVETVAVKVIERPAPGEMTVTKVEEAEIRKASDPGV